MPVRAECLIYSTSGYNIHVKPSQVLIILLLLACLSVDAAVIYSRAFVYPTTLYTYSLPISQIGLLALWAGLGKTPFWIRLPLLIAGAAAWSWFLRQGEGTIAEQWFLVLLVEAGLTLCLVLIARLCAIGVKQLEMSEESAAVQADARLRFSLRDVFVLVTAVCVCLGVMPLLVENWKTLNLAEEDRPMLLAWSGAWAVLSFLTCWLALGRRFAILRSVLLLLLVVGFAAVTRFDWEPPLHDGAGWVTAEHLLLTYLSLMVVRLCGYRVVGQRG